MHKVCAKMHFDLHTMSLLLLPNCNQKQNVLVALILNSVKIHLAGYNMQIELMDVNSKASMCSSVVNMLKQ
jgi:hypothetical protein